MMRSSEVFRWVLHQFASSFKNAVHTTDEGGISIWIVLSWMLDLVKINLVISCQHYSSDQSWWKELASWVMQSWLSKLALSQVVRMNQKMDVK